MLYVNLLWRSSFAFYFISSRANHVCLVLHFFPSSEWHFLEILFVFHLWHFRFQFHLYGDILKSFGYIFRYRRWPNEHSACKQIKNFSACVERVWFVINCSSNNCRIIRMWCRFSVGFQVYVSTPKTCVSVFATKIVFSPNNILACLRKGTKKDAANVDYRTKYSCASFNPPQKVYLLCDCKRIVATDEEQMKPNCTRHSWKKWQNYKI